MHVSATSFTGYTQTTAFSIMWLLLKCVADGVALNYRQLLFYLFMAQYEAKGLHKTWKWSHEGLGESLVVFSNMACSQWGHNVRLALETPSIVDADNRRGPVLNVT